MKGNEIHYAYAIVACCCLIMGINVGLVMSCAGIFYQPVSQSLGIFVGALGLYMSFNYLFSTLTLPLAGWLIEKYSARLLLTVASLVLGLAVTSMSLFAAAWQFYAAGSVIGITMAFLLYLSFPTMVNRWFRSRVGFFIGVCSAASGIGGILFNPLGAWLISDYGWRTAYVVFGAMILFIVTPLLAFFLRNYPSEKGLEPHGETLQNTATAKPTEGVAYAQAVRMPVFYCLLVFALLMISVSTLNLFIPKYITDLAFSLEQASFVASAVMIGVTVGKVVLGIINDRNATLGVTVTVSLGILGLLLLIFGKAGIAVVLAGGFLFGWAYAGVTVQTPMLVREVFGNRNYASIYANISMAFAVGGALMAGAWGLLADITSFQFILILGVVFLALCGMLGLYALNAGKCNRF